MCQVWQDTQLVDSQVRKLQENEEQQTGNKSKKEKSHGLRLREWESHEQSVFICPSTDE